MFLDYCIEQYDRNTMQEHEHWALIQFLADIIKNSSNPVVAYAANGQFIAFNPAFERLSGYTAEELKHCNWLQLIPAGSSAEYYLGGKEQPTSNNPVHYEHVLIRKDGALLPIKYLIQVIRFPGDESTCYLGFITDISEQRRMEQSLRYQTAFEELLGHISTRFINLGANEIDNEIERTLKYIGEFVRADRAYVFSYSDRRKVMNNTHEWCAPGISSQKDGLQDLSTDDFAWWIEQLYQSEFLYIPSVGDMPPDSVREMQLLLNQEIKSLLVVPMLYQNRPLGFLGFDQVAESRTWSNQDIALLKIVAEIFIYALERKRAARRLDTAIRMIDSISEGIMIVDLEKVTWVNQAFTSLTGYSYEEVAGHDYSGLGLTKIEPELVDRVNEGLTKNGTWQGILTGHHKNGYYFPVILFISAIHSHNTNNPSYFVIFADISEQDRLNHEKKRLKQQTAQLQRLNSLSAMSAGLVHEIAQPLNSIKVLVDGMLYCHQNHYPLAYPEIFGKMADISLELGRIDEIIRHIRSFANLSDRPELEPCNWNEVLARALKMLGRQLAAHSINVTTELAKALPIMRGNLNRLDEVMINLLVNAMQALDVSEKADKQIHCRTFANGNLSCLEISDNALGIEQDLMDTIFEPFVTTKASHQGMGLGLSVVQSIMGGLNGQVQAMNNDYGGATFRLELSIIDLTESGR